MKRMILCLAALLVLTGCSGNSEPEITAAPETTAAVETTAAETTQPTTEPTVPKTTVPTEPVYVYSGAVEDYLLPLEDYSWRREHAPEYVMLHFTSAVTVNPKDPYDLTEVRKIFTDYGVSIHYLLDRDGTVYCYVPEDLVAWHAGAGSFAGDEKYTNKMNHYAIGIEILAIGSQEDMSIYLTPSGYDALDDSLLGYTDAQYAALRQLVADICQRNGIPMDRAHVIGHEDYSPKKNDPGDLFDWDRLFG